MPRLSGLGFFRTCIGYILILSKELLQSMGTGGIRNWGFTTFVTGSNSPELCSESLSQLIKINLYSFLTAQGKNFCVLVLHELHDQLELNVSR